eukprot:COSAG02_NODE_8011_length_2747_cov_1.222810_1_plen_78_part_00
MLFLQLGTPDIKNWRQVFPGVRGKQLKKKRRASKDHEALILQFKKMAEQMAEEKMKMPTMKMQRMETPRTQMMAQEE